MKLEYYENVLKFCCQNFLEKKNKVAQNYDFHCDKIKFIRKESVDGNIPNLIFLT